MLNAADHAPSSALAAMERRGQTQAPPPRGADVAEQHLIAARLHHVAAERVISAGEPRRHDWMFARQ